MHGMLMEMLIGKVKDTTQKAFFPLSGMAVDRQGDMEREREIKKESSLNSVTCLDVWHHLIVS